MWSQADLERLLVTAERLSLDPLGGEIYALPRTSFGLTDTSTNGPPNSPVILALSIDGWSKVINAHPQFDGMRFSESQAQLGGLPLYLECTLFRKDRRVATSVREYMSEANTESGAWLTHPRRMLRHNAMVQCARLSFGLGCLHEPDLSRETLYRTLSSRCNPTIRTLSAVLKATGLKFGVSAH